MSDQWGLVPLPLGDTFAAAPGAQPNQPLLPFGGYIEGQASGGSAVAYTATGLAGSYSVTGRSASVVLARKAAGLAGSYTVTGQSATVVVGRKASGLAGSYTVTGQTATVVLGHKASGNAGSYVITGVDTNATYTPGAGGKVNYTATALPGSYTYSGVAATVSLARKAAGNAGNYTVTGQNATAVVGRKASGSAGSYAVTGNNATVVLGRKASATAGSYTITGNNATGTYYAGGSPIAYSATGLSGSYIITGQLADGVYSGAVVSQGAGGEPVKRKRVVLEKDGKLYFFQSAAQASAYVAAEKAIQKAQESSRKGPESAPVAFKSNRPVPKPEVVDINALQAFYTAQQEHIQKLAAQKQYDQLMTMQLSLNAAIRQQEEDDIELLLLIG